MKIAIIGAGAMGGAMADGFIKSGAVKPADISVANPTAQKLEHFALQGASVTTDNKTAAEGADIVVIAVKPWLVEQVVNELKPVLNYTRQTIITVAAGISGSQFTAWLKKDDAVPQTFIVIPNTAIAVLASMTFIVPVNATADTTSTIKALFDNVGQTMVTDERHLSAGMTLASCGIAYAMRYVHAAAEGGVELGFKADMAKDIVLQTMKGAVELLQANGNHPEAEIDKVCTPGGLTIRGLNEMEHAGFTSAVIRGLKAATK
jgi:pyrroline-5-carboxylate reductase